MTSISIVKKTNEFKIKKINIEYKIEKSDNWKILKKSYYIILKKKKIIGLRKSKSKLFRLLINKLLEKNNIIN